VVRESVLDILRDKVAAAKLSEHPLPQCLGVEIQTVKPAFGLGGRTG
jgi:hypothetical protein